MKAFITVILLGLILHDPWLLVLRQGLEVVDFPELLSLIEELSKLVKVSDFHLLHQLLVLKLVGNLIGRVVFVD